MLLEALLSFMFKFHLGPYQLDIKAFPRVKNTKKEENKENVQVHVMPSCLSVSKHPLSPWLAEHRLAVWLFPLKHRQHTSNMEATQSTPQTW